MENRARRDQIARAKRHVCQRSPQDALRPSLASARAVARLDASTWVHTVARQDDSIEDWTTQNDRWRGCATHFWRREQSSFENIASEEHDLGSSCEACYDTCLWVTSS